MVVQPLDLYNIVVIEAKGRWATARSWKAEHVVAVSFLTVWFLLTDEFQVSFVPILSFSSCAMTGSVSFISPWVV